MKKPVVASAAALALCLGCTSAPQDSWTDLLANGLEGWDSYLSYPGDQIMSVINGAPPPDLKPIGLNNDTFGVFTMIEQDGEPVLRISGEIYGAVATKESFDNFHFKAKFKWGEKKWQPRLEELKDSGILYFSVGEFGVDYWHSWMESQELQIIEGGIGDYWTIAGSEIEIRAHQPEGSELFEYSATAPALRFAAGSGSKDAVANHCRRGEDRERPGEWNEVELVCFNGNCVHIANGGVVMALQNSARNDAGTLVPLTHGKLQIQSEAAEVFYKDIKIRRIDAMPSAFAQYFD